jgi:hypothetical protein
LTAATANGKFLVEGLTVKHAIENKRLLELAAKYVWWTSPDITVSENIDKLVANVMELGTWDDAVALLDTIGADPFLEILDAPPIGVISDKSLAFWHHRLGREGTVPKSRRRFG